MNKFNILVIGIILYFLYKNSNNITNNTIHINRDNYIGIILILSIIYCIINKINLMYPILLLTVLIIFSEKFRNKIAKDTIILNIQKILEPYLLPLFSDIKLKKKPFIKENLKLLNNNINNKLVNKNE